MTTHQIKLTLATERQFMQNLRSSILVHDDDYQAGDIVWLVDQNGRSIYRGRRTVTHVLKNWTGLQAGFVVLSFDNAELEFLRQRSESRSAYIKELRRSNAALRGQITKLRNRLARGAS